MKPLLKREEPKCYHFVGGEKIYGAPSGLSGDVTGLRGNVTGLRGNVTGLSGDVTGLWGDVTGLRGNVTGLWGDADACEITDEEREAGIDVALLIGGAK